MLQSLTNQLILESGSLKARIATAETTNAKKKKLLEQYYSLNAKSKKLGTRYENLNALNSMVMRILAARRDSIIQSICDRTEAILGIVFPDEDFKIRITYKPYGKNYVSEVFVGKTAVTGNIIWGRPKGTNGEFMKQLISFSILASINTLLDSGFLLMDEPFSSSDPVNVRKMQPILSLMLQQGLQLLFIEHKRELYENMPHMLIQLIKHRSPTDEHCGYVEVLRNERVNANEQADQPLEDSEADE